MTTALDIIKRATRLIGVASIGETPSNDEAQDALTALNALLQTYGTGLLVYAKSLDSITLISGQAAYTVGPTGATVTTRPAQVLDACYVNYQGTDYPVSVWTQQDYNSISDKTISGIPGGLYPLMDMPNITLSLWPVPSAAMVLKLASNKPVTSFAALTTTVTLPPGYEQALAFLLAESIAPEYELPVPSQVMREAARVRRTIKRANAQVPRMTMPYGIPDHNNYTDGRVP